MSDIFNVMRSAVKRVDRLSKMLNMFNEAETLYVIKENDKLIALVYGIHELQAFLASRPTQDHYKYSIFEFSELLSIATDTMDIWKQIPKDCGINYIVKVGEKVYGYVYRPKSYEQYEANTHRHHIKIRKGGYSRELTGLSIASRDKLQENVLYTRPDFKEIDWLDIDKNIVTIFKRDGKLYGCNKDIHYIYGVGSESWDIVNNPQKYVGQNNEDKLDKALYPIVIEIPKWKYHGQIMNYLDDWNKIPDIEYLTDNYIERNSIYRHNVKQHKTLFLKRPKGF